MNDRMDLCITKYVIQPRDYLFSQVKILDSGFAAYLLQTVLWSKSQGQRSIWRIEDNKFQIKLLFLASLDSNFSSHPGYSRLFSDLSINICNFDKYWTIKLVDDEENVDEIENEIAEEALKKIDHCGNAIIDGWIDNIKAKNSLPSN